jgi:Flp pilus assembly protein TadD
VSDAQAPADKPTSKRLATLEKLAIGAKADAFTKYGLAMEYVTLGRIDDAERAFEALRAFEPTYVPMYYQAGVLMKTAGRIDDARAWLEQGVVQAKAKGDSHALGEIQGVLAGL